MTKFIWKTFNEKVLKIVNSLKREDLKTLCANETFLALFIFYVSSSSSTTHSWAQVSSNERVLVTVSHAGAMRVGHLIWCFYLCKLF